MESALIPNSTMQNINTQAQTLTELNIEINVEELVEKIQTGSKRPDILATAEKTLNRINNIWNPAIVYRWLPFELSETEPGKSIICSNKSPLILDLGHSSIFVREANCFLVAAYSAGSEIEKEANKSSENENLLVSFIIDLIGLLVLEKTGDIVKKIAERKAADLNWGVSPFLSPGSIHGWDLEDQLKLCSLLPLNEINVQISNDAVLIPFKSLSCLIGIGAGYEATLVGTTCQVCSRNNDCQMKQL